MNGMNGLTLIKNKFIFIWICQKIKLSLLNKLKKKKTMKIELKGIKFYEKMSEETNSFTADIYVDGKRCGFAKNDGRGGCTFVSPIGGKTLDLFTNSEKWLTEQPEINIGTEENPFMVKSNMENVVDQLFEQWLKGRDQKKLEKKMESCLIWGVPNGERYTFVNYKQKLTNIPKNVLQDNINYYKQSFKEGEIFLNTNLVGFEL